MLTQTAPHSQYGSAEVVEYLQALSKNPAIQSIHGCRHLFLNGQVFPSAFSPGGFELLIREQARRGRDFRGDAIIAISEESKPIAEGLIATMEQRGWSWVHPHVSGSSVTLWFVLGNAETFYEMTGTRHPRGGPQGKPGLKRDRVATPSNSPLQGAFVTWRKSRSHQIFLPDGRETTWTELHLPGGKTLKVLAIPEEHNANDGDSLLKWEAVEALAEATDLRSLDQNKVDFVQYLISGADMGLKAMGQTTAQVPWPEEYEEWDILIGTEGTLPDVQRDTTIGKVTARERRASEDGLLSLDGLETVVNGYLNTFEPKTMLKYGRLIALRNQMRDQRDALSKPAEELASDYLAQDVVEERRTREEQRLEAIAWAQENAEQDTLGALALKVTGSSFADPTAGGPGVDRVPRKIRGRLKKSATNGMESEGLPGAILPGAKLKLCWWMFSGVEEPPWGEIRLGFRPDGTVSRYSVNGAQYGTEEHRIRTDSDDCDDESYMVPGWDPDTGTPWANMMRTPSSPDGGTYYKMTMEDAVKVARQIPFLPMRKGWGHRDPDLATREPRFTMGEPIVPQGTTQDLHEILKASRFAAKEPKNIGQFSNSIQAFWMAGDAAKDIKFTSSDLIDNVWNQNYEGEAIVNQADAYSVMKLRAGQPWYRPAYLRHKKRVEELYRRTYGEAPEPVFVSMPELETMFRGLVELDDMSNLLGAILRYRRGGPTAAMVERVDEKVALQAAMTILDVGQLWSDWGRKRKSLYRSGMTMGAREKAIGELTASTLKLIRGRVRTGFKRAALLPNFSAGEFATALRQVQLSQGKRWEDRSGENFRIRKADALLPKEMYKLHQHLPARELIAYFTRGEVKPSWVSRLINRQATWEIDPNDRVEITKSKGRWQISLEASDRTSGSLGKEAIGLAGLKTKFIGFVPVYESIKRFESNFYGPHQVAVFENEHKDVLNEIAKVAHAADLDLKAACALPQ